MSQTSLDIHPIQMIMILLVNLDSYRTKFTILSLNCQSLNAKIDHIKAKLYYFGQHDIHFSVICLQETWLDEN